MSRRRANARIDPQPGVTRGERVRITVDERPLDCYVGESVAAAMIAESDDLTLRQTASGEPRGLFCGMGVCFECLVVVDGVPNTRACMTWVRDGMAVGTQVGPAGRGGS
ncbi:(2Fe-2S)-binding protein [Nocardioides sp. 503]|uniref:(2Fe-2S)-binding protein n=1 Tax=Nocardioides sp. 503 TaxID=2508326 RepID=UPI001FD6EF7E|nr:(2Fe-2S)-binding protein [Nocardioides sp. 503]